MPVLRRPPRGDSGPQSSRSGSAASSARTAASQKPRKPSPSLRATRSMNACGTREALASGGARTRRAGGAAQRTSAGARHGPSPQDEDAMPGEEGHGGVAHLLHDAPGAPRVVHRPLVLVDEGQRAAAERRALVEDRRHFGQVGPHGAEERVVVHGPPDVGAQLVELEVERDPERDRPVPLDRRARRGRSRSTCDGRRYSAQVSSHGRTGACRRITRLTVMCPARWSL